MGDTLMKNKGAILLGAVVGGIVGGFVLSGLIGIAGMLLLDRPVGIKYLPIILPIICVLVALLFVNIWTPRK